MVQEYNCPSGIQFGILANVLVELMGYCNSGHHQGHAAGVTKGLGWVLESALSIAAQAVLFHCLRVI